MKQIAPSVPTRLYLTQPSLVPRSAYGGTAADLPAYYPPPRLLYHHYQGASKRGSGEGFYWGSSAILGRSKQTPDLPPAGSRQFQPYRKATI